VTATRSFAIVLALLMSACEGSPTLPPRVQAAARPASTPNAASKPGCSTRRGQAKGSAAHLSAWGKRLNRLAAKRSVGIAVADRGNILYERQGDARRTPASNEKLLLSMALFDQLSPSYRIRTTVSAGHVVDGVVRGDLWLLGGGDPSLTTKAPHFWGPLRSATLKLLAERLRGAGISHIEGSVRGGATYFAHDFNAPGWQPFVPRNYVQLPTALAVNGNYHVRGGPERTAARSLDRQLRARGIKIDGAPSTGEPPAHLVQIGHVSSPPLSRLTAFMDGTSDNFFAEMLGKLLGADFYGPPGTIHKGAVAISTWARRSRVHLAAYDSSGLSYRDRISPLGIVRLLAAAERRPWGPVLRRDLPSPGQGTLRGRLAGLDVHAKTGTLFNSDSALSGWVRNRRTGRWLEFSILDQNMPKTVEDRMVQVIAHAAVAVGPAARHRRPVCS
jgi:serine-type D-Ala-D-Ala carboxypeptidase/endopeptidase (penicillin-binding protein 4)